MPHLARFWSWTSVIMWPSSLNKSLCVCPVDSVSLRSPDLSKLLPFVSLWNVVTHLTSVSQPFVDDFFKIYFLSASHDIWDVRPPSRHRTFVPYIGKAESSSPDNQRNPWWFFKCLFCMISDFQKLQEFPYALYLNFPFLTCLLYPSLFINTIFFSVNHLKVSFGLDNLHFPSKNSNMWLEKNQGDSLILAEHLYKTWGVHTVTVLSPANLTRLCWLSHW